MTTRIERPDTPAQVWAASHVVLDPYVDGRTYRTYRVDVPTLHGRLLLSESGAYDPLYKNVIVAIVRPIAEATVETTSLRLSESNPMPLDLADDDRLIRFILRGFEALGRLGVCALQDFSANVGPHGLNVV